MSPQKKKKAAPSAPVSMGRTTALVPATGVARQVIAYLKQTFPRPSSPKEIAFATGCSYEAVAKVCQRNRTHIAVARKGLYRYFADAQTVRLAEVSEPKIHAVCIVAPVSGRPGGALFAATGLEEDQRSWDWRGRRVTMQFWAGKRRGRGPRIAVFLKASKKPVSVIEFMEFLREWAGAVRPFGVDPDDPRVRVRELDVNADFAWPKVGLRGVESMTLHGFRGGLLKAYHKRSINALRLEACLWPVDLQPAEVARIFGELTRPLIEKQERDERPPGPEFA